MGKRKIKTTYEITENEYLQLEGLKALYEKISVKREMIMDAFVDIVNLSDEECNYDKGGYILQDNENQNYDLKQKLEESDIKIKTD